MKKADNKKRCGTDYYALFLIGIVWLVIGIPTRNTTFFLLGFVFLIIGLTNKQKWKKRCRWKDLSKKEKINKILLIIISILIAFLFEMMIILFAR